MFPVASVDPDMARPRLFFFWVADADGEKCAFYYHDIPLYMFYASKTKINQPWLGMIY